MKIYTRTGDNGLTSLIGGTRVPKFHIRIESYGTIDELNSYIGLITDQNVTEKQKDILKLIQDRLFIIGATLASDPDKSRMKLPELKPDDITLLEEEIDRMEHGLPELRNFILPGGSTVVSFCHIARCICRRAERITVQLAEESKVEEKIIIYLNRLSDFLFVLARTICYQQGIPENEWNSA